MILLIRNRNLELQIDQVKTGSIDSFCLKKLLLEYSFYMK
jgi:hypothetical protein